MSETEATELVKSVARLEAKMETVESTLQRNTEKVSAMAMELHGAKVGGRVFLAIALTIGGVVGWAVKAFLATPKH